MDVKLLIKKGSNGAEEIGLTSPETLVGRQKGCKLRIPSGTVSRQHCRLLFEDDRLYVEDLNSANGTFINGVRIHGRQALLPGDQLEIGPVVFVANYLLVESDEPPVPVVGVPLEMVEAVEERHAEAPAIEVIPLADDEPTVRDKRIPADDAPIPLALVEDEEPIPLALAEDEEVTLNTSGDEDLRDLLSQMQ